MAIAAELTDPTPTDVVVAVLGASAALAGFILVFLGLLIAARQSFPADTPKTVKEKHTNVIWPVLAVFGFCIAVIGLAFAWLAAPGGTCLYRTVIWLFAAELLAIVGVGAMTTVRLLRG